MAMTYAYKGKRVGETYIKCECVGISSECDSHLKYIYKPVCGDGEITLEMPDKLGDNVVPMEHLRMKTQVDLLTKLKYPRARMSEIIGAPEYLIDFYLPKNYVGLEIADAYRKCNEVEALCAELTEKNAKLSQALESVKADNLQFEQRGKELTEETANLAKQIADFLTKQPSDLQDAYHRLYGSRDDHVKHIEALEFRVKELSEENEGMRTTIEQLSEAKNAWAEEALRYKEELATANAKHADAMRKMNCLRTAVSTWRSTAFDYRKKCAATSNEYGNLAAEVERLRTHNKTLTDLITDLEQLRVQRNMAIRLLFCTHDYDEIANALHIPESLVRVIIAEVNNDNLD